MTTSFNTTNQFNQVNPFSQYYEMSYWKNFGLQAISNGVTFHVLNSLQLVQLEDGNNLMMAAKLGTSYSAVKEVRSVLMGEKSPLMSGNIKAFLDSAAYNSLSLLALSTAGLDEFIANIVNSMNLVGMDASYVTSLIQGTTISVIQSIRTTLTIMYQNGQLPATAKFILAPVSSFV